jgi:peptidylprolyl isomerase
VKFFSSKRLVAAVLILAIGVLIGTIATRHSTTRKATVTSNSSSASQFELPTVSATAGQAPTISAPTGTAPTTLESKEIIVGTGAQALSSSTVTAQYVLMSWKSGKVLQSSWSSGPFTAPLTGVIPGWQQGIPGMKVGGRRLLVIPPALAYGAAGSGPIGPNETLVFVVDLLGVK